MPEVVFAAGTRATVMHTTDAARCAVRVTHVLEEEAGTAGVIRAPPQPSDDAAVGIFIPFSPPLVALALELILSEGQHELCRGHVEKSAQTENIKAGQRNGIFIQATEALHALMTHL